MPWVWVVDCVSRENEQNTNMMHLLSLILAGDGISYFKFLLPSRALSDEL